MAKRALGIIYSDLGEEGRAQCLRTSLLSNREKRLLVIVIQPFDFEPIPHPPELDSKFFRQILASERRWELVKMGAQQFINIDRVGDRWNVFEQELYNSKVVFQSPQQQSTEDDGDNSSIFFVGSNTAVINEIMKFLHSHQKNSQIIGLLGQTDNLRMIPELEYVVKKEANLFDDMVCVYRDDDRANKIQEKLGSMLVLITARVYMKEHNIFVKVC